MTMIDTTDSASIDAAIDAAVDDLRHRMAGRGDGFEVMSAALTRAVAGGKRLRPALVTGAYRALGGDPASVPAVMQVAAAFELLHAAFVIHDDVIDHDTVRRGIPNIGGEFRARAGMRGAPPSAAADVGDAAGILAGDLLLYESQRIIARVDTPAPMRRRLLELLDDAVVVSAAGELADVEHAALPDAPDLEDTLAATRNKTAIYSFSAPLRAGAVLAAAPTSVDTALEACGTRLGIAFQLVDDLIGAFGDTAQAGRSEGVDLVAAKRTPIVALARKTARWPRVHQALALAHTGPVALREAQQELNDSGAAEQTRVLVDHEVAAALDAARALPPRLRTYVHDLASAVQARQP